MDLSSNFGDIAPHAIDLADIEYDLPAARPLYASVSAASCLPIGAND
jgi:hypothetical protein